MNRNRATAAIFIILVVGAIGYAAMTPSRFVLAADATGHVEVQRIPALGTMKTFAGVTGARNESSDRSCRLIVDTPSGSHELVSSSKPSTCSELDAGAARAAGFLRAPSSEPVVLYEAPWRSLGVPGIGLASAAGIATAFFRRRS
jgi:hypothetical protein